MSEKNVQFCKNCGKEIAKEAVICPGCGVSVETKQVKKALYKRWWFWVIIVLVAIGIGSCSSGENDTSTDTPSAVTEQTPEATEEPIVYTPYQVSELINDLDDNALKAEKKYDGQYVEITGKLRNIDSDGNYITLEPANNQFTITSVMCNIENDEQLDQVIEMSIGDIVTVRGKITDVGEIMGYSLKIDSIN